MNQFSAKLFTKYFDESIKYQSPMDFIYQLRYVIIAIFMNDIYF